MTAQRRTTAGRRSQSSHVATPAPLEVVPREATISIKMNKIHYNLPFKGMAGPPAFGLAPLATRLQWLHQIVHAA
jgi:hypothetical protein